MVDLDSDPTKLLDVVEIGKQQLITRGALTTFSTFSAEIISLLQNGKFSLACLAISLHLIGSLLCTFLGMAAHHYLTAQA